MQYKYARSCQLYILFTSNKVRDLKKAAGII